MPPKTYNGVPVADILKHAEWDISKAQIIPNRTPAVLPDLTIAEPDPKWPEYFELFKSRIISALESPAPTAETAVTDDAATPKVTILAIRHVGSTSVPSLPAKAVIDIDLVLSSNTLPSEPYYVPRLEAAGFEFRLREPEWQEHRFFRATEPLQCNLHVWGPGSPEAERHKIFRDWLRGNEGDRELYAKVKREAAAASTEKGEMMEGYTKRKEWVIREIIVRAFRGVGLLEGEGE